MSSRICKWNSKVSIGRRNSITTTISGGKLILWKCRSRRGIGRSYSSRIKFLPSMLNGRRRLRTGNKINSSRWGYFIRKVITWKQSYNSTTNCTLRKSRRRRVYINSNWILSEPKWKLNREFWILSVSSSRNSSLNPYSLTTNSWNRKMKRVLSTKRKWWSSWIRNLSWLGSEGRSSGKYTIRVTIKLKHKRKRPNISSRFLQKWRLTSKLLRERRKD